MKEIKLNIKKKSTLGPTQMIKFGDIFDPTVDIYGNGN